MIKQYIKKKMSLFFYNSIMPIVKHYVNEKVEATVHDYVRNFYDQDLLGRYHIFGEQKRVHIALNAVVNNALFNVISGEIYIEEYVFFGHNVSILTGTHDWHVFGLERQEAVPSYGRNVFIKKGAWIASNATVIGPCVIGENAVVAAGSVVIKDVEPYSIVAGNPAKIIQYIK